MGISGTDHFIGNRGIGIELDNKQVYDIPIGYKNGSNVLSFCKIHVPASEMIPVSHKYNDGIVKVLF